LKLQIAYLLQLPEIEGVLKPARNSSPDT